ncbi:hypothetical protein V5739_05525 [Salinimicrobium sp. TIG7-5_MAKvit]|uniref:hypothetical protein n=1 Tax=Salinimicrobium sp. TIG7-5_MAKvit TaxID=3121289 RepID=UPI003C6DBEFC
MNFISIISPLIGVILGFTLSQFEEFFKERKNKKRTLNKLLFNLLNLYSVLYGDLKFEESIGKFFEKFSKKMSGEISDQEKKELVQVKEFINNNLKHHFVDEEKHKFIENNIENIINELAEINPVFAFELDKQYKIKERVQRTDSYLSDIKLNLGEAPFDIEKWIRPELTNQLLKNLSEVVLDIAKSINSKTYEKLKIETLPTIEENDTENSEELINDFIAKIETVGNTI